MSQAARAARAARAAPAASAFMWSSSSSDEGHGVATPDRETLCPALMDEVKMIPGKVVLMDNSNIFIEGQKVAGKGLADPSWRVDHWKLVAHILGDHDLAYCGIFGSRPPKSDEVWKQASRGHRVTVDLTERSTVTGKEERVDLRLAATIPYEVANFYDGVGAYQQRRYAIVGGDSDYSIVVMLAIAAKIPVDIYSWRAALHPAFLHLQAHSSGLVKVHYLDDYVWKIGFVERLSDEQKLQRAKSMPGQTLVFLPSDKMHPDALWEKLQSFHRSKLSIPTAVLRDPAIEDGKDKMLLIMHNWMHHQVLQKTALAALREMGLDSEQVKMFAEVFPKEVEGNEGRVPLALFPDRNVQKEAEAGLVVRVSGWRCPIASC